MNYRRTKRLKINATKDQLYFQALYWKAVDLDLQDESDYDSDEEDQKKYKKKDLSFAVRVYGVTDKGESCALHITGFSPYFFLRVPSGWGDSKLRKLRTKLKSLVKPYQANALIGAEFVVGEDLYFFNNKENFKFIKFSFKTLSGWYAYRKVCEGEVDLKVITGKSGKVEIRKRETGFGLYESNLEPLLRMIHTRELNAAGWLRVPKKGWFSSYFTKCQIEGVAKLENVEPVVNHNICPMRILSFDIECISEDGSFPDASRDNDMVIQIGSTMHICGQKDVCLKHVVVLGKSDPIDGAIVECCKTEKELLERWCKFIDDVQPDVMTGYNIWGFDWEFLWKRSEKLKCQHIFEQMGKHLKTKNQFEERKLSSSALGDNLLKYVDIEGVVQIDMLKLVQRDHKLDSYKLDAVAEHFMGLNKVDLSPKQLFANFREGTPDKLKEIAVYCIQDNALCNQLIMKLSVIANNIGMANVCSVPFSYLFIRGQSVKIFSVVAKQCRKEGILIPTVKKADVNPDSYEGAIVFVPEPRLWHEPITVLDYASLYPSCMIAENISHDTLVCYYEFNLRRVVNGTEVEITREEIIEAAKSMKEVEFHKKYQFVRGDLVKTVGNEKFLDMDGAKYNKITYDIQVYIDPDNPNKGKVKVGEKDCIYIDKEGPGVQGVLPRILIDMLHARRSTRSKIKFKTAVLADGSEISGLLKDKDDMYEIKTEFEGVKTVPKDIVTEVKDTYSDFMKGILDGLQLAYKVVCNSVYGQTGASISPLCLKELAASTTAAGRGMVLLARKQVLDKFPKSECVYGDSVTAETPVLVKSPDGVVQYIQISELGNKWDKCVEDGKEEKEFCSLEGKGWEAWSDDGWTPIKNVIRHELAPHKKVFRVHTKSGFVEVTDDHSLLNARGEMIKPKELLNVQELMHRVYPNWKYEDVKHVLDKFDIDKRLFEKCIFMCQVGENDDYCYMHAKKRIGKLYIFDSAEEAATAMNVLTLIGFFVDCQIVDTKFGISFRDSDKCRDCNVYPVEFYKEWKQFVKMEKVEYSGYVYDLTTGNHHFQAGIGSIIVHNTDSVFINFTNYLRLSYPEWDELPEDKKIALTIQAGKDASAEVQKVIKDPHELEYEKIFYPFCIFTKKRYFGNKYEFDPTKCKQAYMGIALKRRDYAPIVKELYSKIIGIILNQRGKDAIMKQTTNYFRDKVKDLLEGNVEMKMLTITKSLRSKYSNPTQIAHKVLADRMGKRDPGNKPASNDRIPFLFISPKNLKCYQCRGKISNLQECKCRGCGELYCSTHLKSHSCEIVCRFCKIPREECSVCRHKEKRKQCICNVKQCKTCLAWYCSECMFEHDTMYRKDGSVIEGRHKCKNPVNMKATTGDTVEHPDYIREKKLKLDYRYYFDHQVATPILQIFSMMMDKPESIVADLLIEDTNRSQGVRGLRHYFGGGGGGAKKSKVELKEKSRKIVDKKPKIQMSLMDQLQMVKDKRKALKEKSKSPERSHRVEEVEEEEVVIKKVPTKATFGKKNEPIFMEFHKIKTKGTKPKLAASKFEVGKKMTTKEGFTFEVKTVRGKKLWKQVE